MKLTKAGDPVVLRKTVLHLDEGLKGITSRQKHTKIADCFELAAQPNLRVITVMEGNKGGGVGANNGCCES